MKDFDKIYIINLHGGGEINGIKDENVFAIQQNVCIAIFVKNDKIKDKGVFQTDLIGKRLEKFKTLPELDRKSFKKLEIDEFNKAFKSTNWGKNRFADNLSFFYPMKEAKAMLEYGKFIGLTDIFVEYTSGIETVRDAITVHLSQTSLKKVLYDFSNLTQKEIEAKYKTGDARDWKISRAKEDIEKNINNELCYQKISYKPFDTRETFYSGKQNGFVCNGRFNVMQHMLKDNIGLVCMRGFTGTEFFNQIFVSNGLVDKNIYGYQSYLAPLYLYLSKESKSYIEGNRSFDVQIDENMVKRTNFKPEFAKMVAEKFENPTPEEVLAYIYAVLHSQTYRTKYLEFLKIDFPRIPFDCDKTSFKKLANIGQELIDAHLMRKIPKSKIGEPESDGVQNFVMEKVAYNEEKQRLYFNKTCYFADVSPSVWEFKIGGYQVLKQYLEGGKSTSRKGMDISSDLTTIQNIIKVLDFTIEKMGEIYDL